MPVASLSEKDEKVMAEPEETIGNCLQISDCMPQEWIPESLQLPKQLKKPSRPKGSAQVLQGLGLLGPRGGERTDIGLRYVIELACFSHP